MPTLIVCNNLKDIRKAFSDSQRRGLPPPRLSDLKRKQHKMSEETEELFIDKLAEVLAEEYKKQERKMKDEELFIDKLAEVLAEEYKKQERKMKDENNA